MMLIDTKFKIGDSVYLKTDVEQQKRLVTGYTIRDGSILYLLSLGTYESPHYDLEISEEVDVLITSRN